jgi:Icc-related predicted phosphoesterase
MRIRCLSDLHLEFTGYDVPHLPAAGEDMVVLAGDIGTGLRGLEWAKRAIPDRPVIYVLGNHEFYRHDFDELLADARACVAGSNVSLLENDTLDIGGLRFLGCTLWTDFRALGEHLREPAMTLGSRLLNDYEVVSRGTRKLDTADTERRCLESVLWLARSIADSDRPTVIVTHHPPTLATLRPTLEGRLLGAVIHNDFDALIQPPVCAWIHGHTHHSVERSINGALVVSNQRGYPRENLRRFRWDYQIAVGVRQHPVGTA